MYKIQHVKMLLLPKLINKFNSQRYTAVFPDNWTCGAQAQKKKISKNN